MASNWRLDRPKKIEVVWLDHHFDSSSFTPEELAEKMGKPWVRATCGYLAEENDDVVMIASTVDQDGKLTEVNTILKSDIVSRRG